MLLHIGWSSLNKRLQVICVWWWWLWCDVKFGWWRRWRRIKRRKWQMFCTKPGRQIFYSYSSCFFSLNYYYDYYLKLRIEFCSLQCFFKDFFYYCCCALILKNCYVLRYLFVVVKNFLKWCLVKLCMFQFDKVVYYITFCLHRKIFLI